MAVAQDNILEVVDSFVAQYNGEYIDEDNWYGSQCWDLVARYAREKWGCPRFPTGSGGAEGLYRLFLSPIPDYFYKVPASELQPGDIAVTTASFYPPSGHTFLVWRREGNTLWCFEQDGSRDYNGDGKADGVAYLVQRNITSKIAGGLRPKGAITMPSEAEVKNYLKVYAGIDKPTDKDIKYYTTRPWSLFAMEVMDGMLRRIQPRPEAIADYFKKYIGPATDKDIDYYTQRPWQVLFDDITAALKKQNAETPLTKESVINYINKNLK